MVTGDLDGQPIVPNNLGGRAATCTKDGRLFLEAKAACLGWQQIGGELLRAGELTGVLTGWFDIGICRFASSEGVVYFFSTKEVSDSLLCY